MIRGIRGIIEWGVSPLQWSPIIQRQQRQHHIKIAGLSPPKNGSLFVFFEGLACARPSWISCSRGAGRVARADDRSLWMRNERRLPRILAIALLSTTMGNTSSNPHPPNSKVPRTVPATPHNGATSSTHKSMRTKKKSLELPDLAMLGISPRPPQQLRVSAPIPIPISPNPNPEAHRHRPRNVHDDSRFTVSDMVVQPSTHIPLYPPATTRQPSYPKTDSNRSESSKGSIPQSQPSEERDSPFTPEVVHSTIPIALHKQLDHSADDDGKRRHKKEEVPMKIYWRGGGKSVILIRAGDDNWKGRQPMEKE